MNNETILLKAIDKAVEGGFNKREAQDWLKIMPATYQCLIFSKDFAKAFWGEEETEYQTEEMKEEKIIGYQKEWRFHLQQMVLEENPIQYISKFI